MTAKSLHEDIVVIDGLIISNWSRQLFEEVHRGGVTVAHCTCSVWEDYRGTMNNVAQWKKWLAENEDLLIPIRAVADIERAKRESKVGIILGWQNMSGIDDQLPLLRVFKDLGVGIMQLTYNTQNSIGAGCYESRDSGLSDFGKEVIDHMNELGILIDLSHVGSRTSHDAIQYSKRPVCYSHTCPRGLKEHPRNKSDDEMKVIADRGGLVGIALFATLLPAGAASTLADYVDVIEYAINVAGEDSIGIGTDMCLEQNDAFVEYCVRDKGYARRITDFGKTGYPSNFGRLDHYPNLTAEMEGRGWSKSRIRKVMGENWMRILKDTWDS